MLPKDSLADVCYVVHRSDSGKVRFLLRHWPVHHQSPPLPVLFLPLLLIGLQEVYLRLGPEWCGRMLQAKQATRRVRQKRAGEEIASSLSLTRRKIAI